MARDEAGGRKRREDGVDLAFGEHVADPLARRRALDSNLRRQIELDALLALIPALAAAHVAQRSQVHAMDVLQHAADPHGGGHGVFRNPDALVSEVGGLADAGVRVHEDRRVAERARGKHRDRDVSRRLALQRH